MEAQVHTKEEPLLKDEIDDVPLSELWKRMHKSEPKITNGKKEHKKKEARKDAPTKTKGTLAKVCGNPTASQKRNKVAVKYDEKFANKRFSNLGQRRETPPKGDPLRLFYESMYEEKKRKKEEATLAETWLLIHGLLEEDQAKSVFEKQRQR
ncbi:hypothetical protein GpartN1_g6238.t1 [Galdieria partita]|uniref:Uncharacterized protein n=1 Tax=Galdieria partita TaxID=83374 RepID=A0A9C7Q2P4_9RHOD|nr:hypothetical protein GpartN1_g6238.t1 [Galdieria partita]